MCRKQNWQEIPALIICVLVLVVYNKHKLTYIVHLDDDSCY